MTIKLYNTLTRQKETFQTIEEGKIKMYVCGPTVYNYIHVGNARPAIVFDTVRRYLEYSGYDVEYVLNFTDVDDKLIKASNEMKEEVPVLADRFIKAYKEDVAKLNVREAVHHPRVTESMDDIIAFIETLIEKDVAYEADGDVYFHTRSFDEYGKLSHQSIDELRSGARIQVGEKKDDPLDFALWKQAKPGEIAWDSPWGKGRPGWHIECSAMARKYLGGTIDIHAGGQDLTFPHHENEIAQSECHNEQTFANYWLHNGYIQINNEKMSKSLGNFILVHELVEKHDPNVVRFFMLSVHYRNPINFSDELLAEAKNSFDRLKTAYQNLQHRKTASLNLTNDDAEWHDMLADLKQRFIHNMNDDFNTANAISVMFELAKEANRYTQQKQTSTGVINRFSELFDEMSTVLGFSLQSVELLDEDIEHLIEERIQARKDRNFKRADEIRDELKAKGIILEDTPQGTRWKRA
ncbi:cysteine--tRNA ligase [Tenuibacillus multivorans]|uniref:Cysteine--tRNA ligase n=1 Tax=Tenuibacillus multivorans TaxID=237069 RepID=A0A1H0F3A3_9BACI|nr:cysteine--tRNA ligase [Tenuibacillus multivorans]GEL78089.1 cysteine--tRNA ligase [Tenuibacillus multivorans]SDN89147.1 cysteinyl-tRNA synthetase [Tenuibacillus multivorans]